MVMKKKAVYTQVTPIPSYIPRQLAIDILHSHGEVITLNPLVLEYHAIKAPRDSPADEFYSTWYEIEQRVQFVPGVGKMGAGKIKFNGCFHDMPWGLQTHIYAPMNVDMRNKWRIAGNQPGEPREPVEMGIGAPPDGLYLREDVEIKCNITMVTFVKKEMQAASKILVDRLIKKAELLDAGVLQAMMEDGKLKTFNPADRSNTMQQPPISPRPQSQSQSSYASYDTKPLPYTPTQPTSQYGGSPYNQGGLYAQNQPQSFAMELPGDYPPPQPIQYPRDVKAAPPPAHLHPAHRYSTLSELSSDNRSPNPSSSDSRRWSEHDPRYSVVSDYQGSDSSRPTSYAPTVSDGGGMRSPRLEQTSFGSVTETREEYELDNSQRDALKKLEGGNGGRQPQASPVPRYNPADYARV